MMGSPSLVSSLTWHIVVFLVKILVVCFALALTELRFVHRCRCTKQKYKFNVLKTRSKLKSSQKQKLYVRVSDSLSMISLSWSRSLAKPATVSFGPICTSGRQAIPSLFIHLREMDIEAYVHVHKVAVIVFKKL